LKVLFGVEIYRKRRNVMMLQDPFECQEEGVTASQEQEAGFELVNAALCPLDSQEVRIRIGSVKRRVSDHLPITQHHVPYLCSL
jgi:hypothetical protein